MINGCELAGGTSGIPFGIKVTQGGKGIPVWINCDPMISGGIRCRHRGVHDLCGSALLVSFTESR
jgi:hypothetical protein